MSKEIQPNPPFVLAPLLAIPPRVIETDRLQLRALELGDGQLLFNLYAHDPAICRYMSFKIDGKVEAFASIMDEIPVSKLTPEPTYACKIWMKDSIEARSFILNRLHISIKRQFDESAWIAVFTDVVLRISSSQQQVMCKGAVFNE